MPQKTVPLDLEPKKILLNNNTAKIKNSNPTILSAGSISKPSLRKDAVIFAPIEKSTLGTTQSTRRISDTTKLNEPMEAECARIEELTTEIEKGHDYVFIGRVGQFCPIKPGCGGGLLCRESVDKKTGEKKYDAAVGTKGYRWLESEMVKELGKEDCIDRRYYDALVDAAATDISKYGDFEWFVSEDPYVSDTPPWFGPGEPHEEDSTPFDVR